MLQIKNLTITHKKDLRVFVQDFSCVLNDGDKAVLIGEEGNGKSTLLKWLYDPALVEDYAEASGEWILQDNRLGYLPQELPLEDGEKTLYDFFQEEPEFWNQTPKELGQLCRQFHLPLDFLYGEQLLKTLSGGEKVKAQLLRLLLAQPTVLLLDEPSNDLDIETLEWLEELIQSWPHIVLFISHDETLIEHTANVVIHLEQLRRKSLSRYTVARMPYEQYVRERLASQEKQEQQARNDLREKKLRDEKFQRIQQSVEHAQNAISRQDPHGGRLLKKKMHAVKSMERRFQRENEDMTAMPESEEAIAFRFGEEVGEIPNGKVLLNLTLDKLHTPEGSRLLAENLRLELRGPEKLCIVGKNGAGKTTFLRKAAEALQSREDISAIYMPQNYGELLDLTQTPLEFLCSTGDKAEITKVRTRLGSLKYTAEEMERPISALSGGQRAKLLLLQLSLSGANVLILDEPTRNFSPLSGPVIRQMLRQFPGAILSVSHDRKYIGEVCDKVYRLDQRGLHLEWEEN